MLAFVVAALAALAAFTDAKVIDFQEIGAVADDVSNATVFANRDLFQLTLQNLQFGDRFIIPNKTFHLVGGVDVSNMADVVIQIDGTLSFTNDRAQWPKDPVSGNVLECIFFHNITNVVFTSSGKGTLDGNGQEWWGAIEFLKHQEDRPRLFHIDVSKNILVENLLFRDSPYWTFWAERCDGLVVRYSDFVVRWDRRDKHTLVDLQAFNTDGFDVTGKNVYMHDLNIWNDDDCIAVKDDSENMLFERINASGLGLVIGSIGGSRVHNITFRDSYMYRTFKGIYMKTRWSDSGPVGEAASISDVTYENIVMDEPKQWAIWIGPAQQTGQPCPLYWPQVPGSECKMSGYQTWSNIVLRNITINNPKMSPGVIIGNSTNPITGLVLDNVVVNNPGDRPWGDDFFFCHDVQGEAVGGTTPVPTCFLK
jgi:polygalacturonase